MGTVGEHVVRTMVRMFCLTACLADVYLDVLPNNSGKSGVKFLVSADSGGGCDWSVGV